ncbi:hypothetical protein L7F22_022406 [Adiantum nelumboides]|nr:hypothetical protein [Adiantum nelumboides]
MPYVHGYDVYAKLDDAMVYSLESHEQQMMLVASKKIMYNILSGKIMDMDARDVINGLQMSVCYAFKHEDDGSKDEQSFVFDKGKICVSYVVQWAFLFEKFYMWLHDAIAMDF